MYSCGTQGEEEQRIVFEEYVAVFLNLFALVPAEMMCYFPMLGRLRRSISGTILRVFLPQFGVIAAVSFLALKFEIKPHHAGVIVFILFFFMYLYSLDVHITKASGVYIYVHSITAILSALANGCDAFIHPELGAFYYTMSDSLLRLLFTTVFAAAVFYPVKKYGTMLIERLSNPKIWVSASLIPGILLLLNYVIKVQKYSTLFVNKVFVAFITVHAVSLVVILLLTFFFYRIVAEIYRETQVQEELRTLKLQERYFKAQQQYMNETSLARHDFKHTIHTLEGLAGNGDIEAIKHYLSRYTNSMPKNETISYCENMALNALLNYYTEQAEKARTQFTLETDVPAELPVTDVEICALIGNILENAMLACMEIEPEDRYIDLVIRNENNTRLYIISENSFNGEVHLEDGKYRSTHSGSGMGLSSVQTVASSCGGTAKFSHEGNVFFSDVILPLDSGGKEKN